MARKPMKEHEKRPIKMFIPELNKVCDVTLEARTARAGLAGRRDEASAAAGRSDDDGRRDAAAGV